MPILKIKQIRVVPPGVPFNTATNDPRDTKTELSSTRPSIPELVNGVDPKTGLYPGAFAVESMPSFAYQMGWHDTRGQEVQPMGETSSRTPVLKPPMGPTQVHVYMGLWHQQTR